MSEFLCSLLAFVTVPLSTMSPTSFSNFQFSIFGASLFLFGPCSSSTFSSSSFGSQACNAASRKRPASVVACVYVSFVSLVFLTFV